MRLNDDSRKGVIFFLIISGIIIGIFYYVYQLSIPLQDKDSQEEIVKIERGASVTGIGSDLYRDRLIRSELIFKTYVKLRGLEEDIQAGYYRLNSNMSIIEIVNKLIKGQTATYKVTVPEGATVEEIGANLVSKGLSKEEFLQLARSRKLDFLVNTEETKYNLEGFLFPETYKFSYGSSEERIINAMVELFKKKLEPLQAEIDKSKYSLYEIITIASMIQAEAKVDEENSLIASVIYNRLNRGMRLQLDATVQYVLPGRKSRLFYSDLEIDSIYNTYKHRGLPPGPVNNPGLAAIKAALNPADTDYLYYVATGDGRHAFSETYAQHLAVQKRLREKRNSNNN